MSLLDRVLEASINSNRTSAVKMAQQRQKAIQKTQEHFGVAPNANTVDHYGSASAPEYGQESASQIEQDAANMNYIDLASRYGEDTAKQLVAEGTAARNQEFVDSTRENSWEGRAADLVNNAGGAVVQGIADTAHLGAMGLDAVTGDVLGASRVTGAISDWVSDGIEEHKSSYQLAQERQYQAEQARKMRDIDNRDYESTFDRLWDQAGATAGSLVDNPEQISNITQSGLGSLISGGLIGSGAKAVASKTILESQKKALRNDIKKHGIDANDAKAVSQYTDEITAKAKELGKAKSAVEEAGILNYLNDVAPYVMANASMEAGSIGKQTEDQIMNYTHEELIMYSADYRKRISIGMSPEKAKEDVARTAARVASASAIPALLAINAVSGRFEASPLASTTVGGAIKTAGKESAEEFLQEGTGTLLANMATQSYADETLDVTKDVVSSAIEGAFAGPGMVAVTKTPVLGAKAVVGATKLAGKGAVKVADKAIARNTTKTQQTDINQFESTVAPELKAKTEKLKDLKESINADITESTASTVEESFDDSVVQAEVDKTNKLIDDMIDTVQGTRSKQSYETAGVSPEFLERNNIEDKESSILQDFIDLTNYARDKDISEEDRYAIDSMLFKKMQDIEALQKSAADSSNLEVQEQAQELLNQIVPLINGNESVKKAFIEASERLKNFQYKGDNSVGPTDKELTHMVNRAIYVPEAVTREELDNTIKLAKNSKVVSPVVIESLMRSKSLIDAAETNISKLKEHGTLTAQGLVSENIASLGNDNIGPMSKLSAKQHMDRITNAMRSNDVEAAESYLSDLKDFATHMSNKVGALAKSYQAKDGSRHTFMARNPSGEWYESKQAYGVTFNSKPRAVKKSLQFAANVEAEANFLVDVYNSMSKANPSLKMGTLPNVTLEGTAKPKEESNSKPVNTPKPEPVVEPVNNYNADLDDSTLFDDSVVLDELEDFSQSMPDEDLFHIAENTQSEASSSHTVMSREEYSNLKIKDGTKGVIKPSETKGNIVYHYDPNATENVVGLDRDQGKVYVNMGLAEDANAVRSFAFKYFDKGLERLGITPENFTDIFSTKKGNYDALGAATFLYRMTVGKMSMQKNRMYPLDKEGKINKNSSMYGYIESEVVKRAMTPYTMRNINRVFKDTNAIQKMHPNMTNMDVPLDAKNSNGMAKAFRAVINSTSRMAFITNPINFFTSRLGKLGDINMNKGINSSWYNGVATQYKEFIKSVTPTIKDNLNNRLNKDKSLVEGLKNGEAYNRIARGQALNIAEIQSDGSLKYNEHFIDLAILAGLQTVITNDSTFNGRSAEDIADALGVDLSSITPEQLEALRVGSSESDFKSRLAHKILQYWGLGTDAQSPEGLYKGIAESVATEVMVAMNGTAVNNGDRLLKRSKITLQTKVDGTNIDKEVYTYIPATLKGKDSIYKMPNVIEDNVLVSPEKNSYLNGETPRTDKKASRDNMELSATNQSSLEAANSVRYSPDEQYINFVEAVGLENLNDILMPETVQSTLDEDGNEIVDRDLKGFNTVARESALSKRSLLADSFKFVKDSMAEAAARGFDELSIAFRHFMSTDKRVHQAHPGNQSGKSTREMLKIGGADMDLNNPDNMKIFNTALAQGFGISTNKQTYETVQDNLDYVLTGLTEQINQIKQWMNDPESVNVNEVLRKAMDTGLIDRSHVAIHNLFEYARYENTADKSNFNPSIYLEIDGITSGSALASLMFGGALLDPNFVDLLNRSGFNITDTDTSYNQKREEGLIDNYEALSIKLTDGKVLSLNNDDSDAGRNTTSMTQAFLDFIGGREISELGDSGEVQTDRNFVKNLLTVLIYGSGSKGIASSYTDKIVKGAYELINKLSYDYARTTSTPDDVTNILNKFKNLNNLMNNRLITDDFGNISYIANEIGLARKPLPETPAELAKFDAKNYRFDSNDLNTVAEVIRENYAEPARELADSVMTSEVMTTLRTIGRGFNQLSMLSKALYNQYKSEYLEAKSKDPSWNRADGLTIEETNEIRDKVEAQLQVPTIANINKPVINKKSRAEKDADSNRGRGLGGEMRLGDDSFALELMGVSGIALTNIGFGDARVTQNFFAKLGKSLNATGVHDGVNFALSEVAEKGKVLNQVALDSMLDDNVLAELTEFFDHIGKISDSVVSDLNKKNRDEFNNEFYRAEISRAKRKGTKFDPNKQKAKDKFEAVTALLLPQAIAVEASHNTLKKTKINSNNYNGLEGVEHIQDGLEYGSKEWSDMYNQEIDKAKEKFEKEFGKKDFSIPPKAKAIETKSGKKSRVKSIERSTKVSTDLTNAGIPVRGNTVNEKIIKMFGSNSKFDGVEIQVGNMDEMLEHHGKEALIQEGSTIKGLFTYVGPTQQPVILVDRTASTETVAHEIIHAGTARLVRGYLNNGIKGILGVSKDKAQAISNAIEDVKNMTKEFLETIEYRVDNGLSISASEMDLFNQMKNLISAGRSADAMLEFMAWGMTNRDVRKHLESIKEGANDNFWLKAEKGIKTLMARVFQYLGIPKAVFNNMYERLAFNTLIIHESNASSVNSLGVESLTHRVNTQELLNNYKEAYDAMIEGELDSDGFTKAVRDSFKGNYNSLYDSRSEGMLRTLESVGVFLDAGQQQAYKIIANTLAGESKLSPSTMIFAQKAFTHTIDNIKPSDFESDTVSATDARNLYKAMTLGQRIDASQGKSYLLPSFIALAAVSPEFANGLSKVDLPGKAKGDGTVDGWARAKGENAVNSLMATASGVSRHSSTIKDVMTDVVVNFVKEQNKSNDLIDKVTINTSRSSDWANDKVAGLFDKAGDAVAKAGATISTNSTNKISDAVGKILNTSGLLVKDKEGELTKDLLTRLSNLSGTPDFIKAFVTDLVGISDQNGDVYALVKKVKTAVQRVRQDAKRNIPTTLAGMFKDRLTKEQWTSLSKSIGSNDLGSLLNTFSMDQVKDFIKLDSKTDAAIKDLESQIINDNGNYGPRVIKKAKELARYMTTGQISNNQLMNASQIAFLQGENVSESYGGMGNQVNNIDSLVSLYALQSMDTNSKNDLKALIGNEPDGIEGLIRYAHSVVNTEHSKDTPGFSGITNSRKGWTPFLKNSRKNIVVVEDSQAGSLLSRGYIRVGDYKGSSADRIVSQRGYYFLDTFDSAPFHQGIIQNIKDTVNGVDDLTGFGLNPSAGVITDSAEVKLITRAMMNGSSTVSTEGLIPIYYSPSSKLPYAYERAIDPSKLELLEPNNNYAEQLGSQKGRQLEEGLATASNLVLIEKLNAVYEEAVSKGNESQYMNILDKEIKDPVIKDAVKLIPRHVIEYANEHNDGVLMVQRGMVKDVVGYRMAVIGDAWSGNNRFKPEVNAVIKDVATAFLGESAFRKLMKAQFGIQDVVRDARTLIVVKSVVVPAVNLVSNVVQLIARGVPIATIAKESPKILNEINYYTKAMAQIHEAQVQREIKSTDALAVMNIDTKIQAINESIKRLEIYPLIEAGEFATVDSGAIDNNSGGLELGDVDSFLERQVDKLPDGVKTLGKYAIVSSDTALYEALQKATDYGDFVAKAILYKDLTTRKGTDQAEALKAITDEFINYDILQGRARHTLENLGLLWFYNWKIRATKIGISTIRNNPLQTIMASNIPMPSMFGSVGLPFEDSILGRLLGTGSIKNSIGPDMGLNAPTLNPWYNLFN